MSTALRVVYQPGATDFNDAEEIIRMAEKRVRSASHVGHTPLLEASRKLLKAADIYRMALHEEAAESNSIVDIHK
jgi:hypothetical protein